EAGPESPLHADLTGPRSPLRLEGRGERHKQVQGFSLEDEGTLARLGAELEALKARTPPLPCAHGIREGGLQYGPSPGFQDARIRVRGSYSRLGASVPRRSPTALGGEGQPPIRRGSGRLELARWIASADHPLTARVMVNRIWQHHFGEGL